MPVFDMPSPEAMHKKYGEMVKAYYSRIKWNDIFNLKELYKAMHEWFKEYQWNDLEDGTDHYETFYFEKIGPRGDKEYWFRWRPQRVVNQYIKYHMDLDFHLLYLMPIEITWEGKKIKKDILKGEIEVKITGLIERDWKNEWPKHPFLKYMSPLFVKRIYHRDVTEEYKRELYRECAIFQNFIKHWLNLKRYLPYEETEQFHVSRAYPGAHG